LAYSFLTIKGFSPRESHAVLTVVDESVFGLSRTKVGLQANIGYTSTPYGSARNDSRMIASAFAERGSLTTSSSVGFAGKSCVENLKRMKRETFSGWVTALSQNVAPLLSPSGEGKHKRAAEATRIYPLWSVHLSTEYRVMSTE
jgi:hypothetical protein